MYRHNVDTETECRVLLSVAVDMAMNGMTTSARVMLDEAWQRAREAWEKTECHDVGNYIQRKILQEYL